MFPIILLHFPKKRVHFLNTLASYEFAKSRNSAFNYNCIPNINIESNENGVQDDSISVIAVEDRILIANCGGRMQEECTLNAKRRKYCLASRDTGEPPRGE